MQVPQAARGGGRHGRRRGPSRPGQRHLSRQRASAAAAPPAPACRAGCCAPRHAICAGTQRWRAAAQRRARARACTLTPPRARQEVVEAGRLFELYMLRDLLAALSDAELDMPRVQVRAPRGQPRVRPPRGTGAQAVLQLLRSELEVDDARWEDMLAAARRGRRQVGRRASQRLAPSLRLTCLRPQLGDAREHVVRARSRRGCCGCRAHGLAAGLGRRRVVAVRERVFKGQRGSRRGHGRGHPCAAITRVGSHYSSIHASAAARVPPRALSLSLRKACVLACVEPHPGAVQSGPAASGEARAVRQITITSPLPWTSEKPSARATLMRHSLRMNFSRSTPRQSMWPPSGARW